MKKKKKQFQENPEIEAYLKKAENPNHIPGIYNYCDRWCERCAFTKRCLTYEGSEEEFKDVKDKGLESTEFWNKLSETYRNTFELIKYISEKQGIDLDTLDTEEFRKEEETKQKKRDQAYSHPISLEGEAYNKLVDQFFKDEKELLNVKGKELVQNAELGIDSDKTYYAAIDINDAIDVIHWYSPQIWVKMMRALSGRFEGEEWQDENGFPRDSDGSSKVALIGIDRSIAAWGVLKNHFPEKNDFFLKLLLHLDKLRRKIEKEFPNARKFIRAGFDEAHLYPEASLM